MGFIRSRNMIKLLTIETILLVSMETLAINESTTTIPKKNLDWNLTKLTQNQTATHNNFFTTQLDNSHTKEVQEQATFSFMTYNDSFQVAVNERPHWSMLALLPIPTLGILFNLLVILVIKRSSKLTGCVPSLMISLATSDILYSTVVIPPALYRTVADPAPIPEAVCYTWHSITSILIASTSLHAAVIMIYGIFGLTNTRMYRLRHQRMMLMVSSVCIWATAILLTVPYIVILITVPTNTQYDDTCRFFPIIYIVCQYAISHAIPVLACGIIAVTICHLNRARTSLAMLLIKGGSRGLGFPSMDFSDESLRTWSPSEDSMSLSRLDWNSLDSPDTDMPKPLVNGHNGITVLIAENGDNGKMMNPQHVQTPPPVPPVQEKTDNTTATTITPPSPKYDPDESSIDKVTIETISAVVHPEPKEPCNNSLLSEDNLGIHVPENDIKNKQTDSSDSSSHTSQTDQSDLESHNDPEVITDYDDNPDDEEMEDNSNTYSTKQEEDNAKNNNLLVPATMTVRECALNHVNSIKVTKCRRLSKGSNKPGKEQLNGSTDKGEHDTQELIVTEQQQDGIENPAFDAINTDADADIDADAETPLADAIKVHHDPDTRSEKSQKSDKSCKNEESDPEPEEGCRLRPKRSILRREGSKKNGDRKSVKFAPQVEAESKAKPRPRPRSSNGKRLSNRSNVRGRGSGRNQRRTTQNSANREDPSSLINGNMLDSKINGKLPQTKEGFLTQSKPNVPQATYEGAQVLAVSAAFQYMGKINHIQGHRMLRRLYSEMLPIWLAFIILALNTLFTLPHIVIRVLMSACTTCSIPAAVYLGTEWLLHAKCLINPLIHIIVCLPFRKSLGALCASSRHNSYSKEDDLNTAD